MIGRDTRPSWQLLLLSLLFAAATAGCGGAYPGSAGPGGKAENLQHGVGLPSSTRFTIAPGSWFPWVIPIDKLEDESQTAEVEVFFSASGGGDCWMTFGSNAGAQQLPKGRRVRILLSTEFGKTLHLDFVNKADADADPATHSCVVEVAAKNVYSTRFVDPEGRL